MSITEIIEGHYKNITNKNSDLLESRLKICIDCKLKKDTVFGEVCNNEIYLNPKTNETSIIKKEGFYKGCGCVIRAKARLVDSKCPINKW